MTSVRGTSSFLHKATHRPILTLIATAACVLSSTPGFGEESAAPSGIPIVLSENRQAKFPIIIPPQASAEIRSYAETLSSYLGQMTGATFTVEEGDGAKGIALGRQNDFSALPKTFPVDSSDPRRQEEYLLATHPQGLLLIGVGEAGVRNAMWDFLGRQGYRQYFPGPIWEIVPSVPRLAVSYDEVQKPSYIMRSIWFSTGSYPENLQQFRDWRQKNRLDSPFHIHAGHAYEGFIARHKEAFAQNPEYFALVNQQRRGPKLNVTHPEVRRLFVEASLNQLRAKPEQISVSADPSDGGGWDESAEALEIGSPSNQAVYLANEVAEGIGQEFPGRYVGMYAYNLHGDPPTIKVHPNVYVLVATSFRGTNLSLEEQMKGWQKQGANLGIRDYLSYAAANYDIPDRCRQAFNFAGVARQLKDYYDWGARLYSGEAGDNWGINGLLYYSVARTLWNVHDTAFIDTLFDEFLTNCFGSVAQEIRPYYEALSPANGPVLEPAFFRRLYDAIEAARARQPGPAIDARLDDLTVYTRYLELYRQYAVAQGEERLKAGREMFSHLYRARAYSANSSYAIIRDLGGRDRQLRANWSAEELRALHRAILLWETRPAYTNEEIRAFSAEGVKKHPRLDFQPISFSKDLIPADSLTEKENGVPGTLGHQSGHNILFYTWADEPGSEWRIKVNATDKIKGQRPRVELWAAEEAEDKAVAVQEIDVAPGETGELVVQSPRKGLHWIVLTGARWQPLELDPAKPWTTTSLSDTPYPSQGAAGACTAYFYVPKGTRILGAHIPGRGVLRNPEGRIAARFDNDGYVKIDIPEGMDGRLWKMEDMRGGNFLLLTVPPYFAATPNGLLLPREVVEADQKPAPVSH